MPERQDDEMSGPPGSWSADWAPPSRASPQPAPPGKANGAQRPASRQLVTSTHYTCALGRTRGETGLLGAAILGPGCPVGASGGTAGPALGISVSASPPYVRSPRSRLCCPARCPSTPPLCLEPLWFGRQRSGRCPLQPGCGPLGSPPSLPFTGICAAPRRVPVPLTREGIPQGWYGAGPHCGRGILLVEIKRH